MGALIKAEHLTKTFGPLLAVDDISLTVGRGEILGFLGPNGAGKSTTMKMLTGFLAPSAGRIEVCGTDMLKNPIAGQRNIGYLPEGGPLYGEMTPKSFLWFVASLRGLKGADREVAIAKAGEALHLGEVFRQPVETLSKGFKRRLGLAQALIHAPPVLVLDEPTDGLDPNQKREVRTLLKKRAKNTAIVISTHILEEVEAVCTRCVIIDRGKIVANGTPKELRARSRFYRAVHLTVPEKQHKAVAKAVSRLQQVAAVEIHREEGEATITAFAERGADPLAEVRALAGRENWPLLGLHSDPGRLDDVFHALTRGKRREAA